MNLMAWIRGTRARRLCVGLALALVSMGVRGVAQGPLADSAEIVNLRLTQMIQSGRLQEAIAFGQAGVQRFPQNAPAHHLLGLAYFKIGNAPGALDPLLRAQELAPRDFNIHYDLALLYLSQRQYPNAAEQLEQALQLQPNSAL